jgi:putative copper resistance protein D
MISLHETEPISGLQPHISEMVWPPEVLPLVAVLVISGLYLWGVRILQRRGDRWPIGRSLAFVLGGQGSILLVTQGPLAYLDTVLLWTHMVQHMILTMIAPIFLALGAPVTLALRTLPLRPRKALLWLLNSLWAKIVTFPLFAGLVFVLNPWILYYTGLYELTLTNPLLHNLNHVHFLIVGSLWIWSLIGIDPMPRMGYPIRMLAVFVTLPFHAFLGLTMMNQQQPIAAHYYEELARSWGPTLLEDQQLAGGLMWVSGDFIGLLLFMVLMIQWAKASDREAVRVDRELDRQESLAQQAQAND